VREVVDAIAAVTADDYALIDFEGKVRNKAATLERIQSSEIQLQSNSFEDLVVRIYGNTAIVTGRATPKGTIGGKDCSRPIRYTRVYVKKDGHWQVVSFQQTRFVRIPICSGPGSGSGPVRQASPALGSAIKEEQWPFAP
jgi:ketosteroid isomerase-like protein